MFLNKQVRAYKRLILFEKLESVKQRLDVARLQILFHIGGIYLKTGKIVQKDIQEEFIPGTEPDSSFANKAIIARLMAPEAVVQEKLKILKPKVESEQRPCTVSDVA